MSAFSSRPPLPPSVGLPDEVEQHEVAGVRLALLLDRVVARRLLAQPIDLLRTSSSATFGPRAVTRRPFQSGSSTSGSVSKTARKRHRLALFELHLLDPGRRERLQAAAVELVEDDLVDDRLGRLAQDLVLKRFLITSSGTLPGRKPGSFTWRA